MIVMSKQARLLLNKIQEYCPSVEYEMTDVEWYAYKYNLSVLNAWWRSRKKNEEVVGDKHVWYLPTPKSMAHKALVTYIKKFGGEKVSPLALDWTENHKQVYHYLCSNVLTCDFNINEFKLILDLGSEFNIQDVQQAAEKTKGINSGSVQYIMATLQRDKQAKDIKAQRVCDAINKSQRSLQKISDKCSSALEVALMRVSFKDIKEIQTVEREMNVIASKRFKWRNRSSQE